MSIGGKYMVRFNHRPPSWRVQCSVSAKSPVMNFLFNTLFGETQETFITELLTKYKILI